MKSWAEEFYYSKSWKKCRESYKKKVHGLCERCGGIARVVHHKQRITPDNINNPTVTLCHDNLEALCMDCHNREHIGGSSSAAAGPGYTFDEAGNIVYAPHFREGYAETGTEQGRDLNRFYTREGCGIGNNDRD